MLSVIEEAHTITYFNYDSIFVNYKLWITTCNTIQTTQYHFKKYDKSSLFLVEGALTVFVQWVYSL
jgi:hypothetical protein